MKEIPSCMIYTDGTHLVTIGALEELHQFAAQIGLKREWFQNKKHPHYDILSRKIRAHALRNGAKLVDAKTLVRMLRPSKGEGRAQA